MRGVEIYVWRLTSGGDYPDVDYSSVKLKFSVETRIISNFDVFYENHYLRS